MHGIGHISFGLYKLKLCPVFVFDVCSYDYYYYYYYEKCLNLCVFKCNVELSQDNDIGCNIFSFSISCKHPLSVTQSCKNRIVKELCFIFRYRYPFAYIDNRIKNHFRVIALRVLSFE